MKKINKNFIVTMMVFALILGFTPPGTAQAATTPSLGLAATFAVLASTFTRNGGLTAVTGDLGRTGGAAGSGTHTVSGTEYVAVNATYTQAGIDQNSALSTGLATQPCTYTFPVGAVDLATDATHGQIGVYTPGVYCTGVASAASIGTAGITLNGSGTYIFRIDGAFTTVANAHVHSAGASSCDVFWTPTSATTIGANNIFFGNVIDAAGITVGSTTSWIGQALAFGGTVTTDTDTISSTCTVGVDIAPVIQGSGPLLTAPVPPLISVVKIPTPLALPLGPGSVTYDYTVSNIGTVAMSNVTVVDNKCSTVGYISGDSNGDLKLDVNETWKYRCVAMLSQTTQNTVTATGQANGLIAVDTADATVVVSLPIVAPLIHVVKTPSVFILPASGGAVTYSYAVTNPGTVPLSNVNITDDKCTGLPGRVLGHPGDLNKNNLLESNESWSFVCKTNLTKTTTNTGTASGEANGITAVDHAFATVVVGSPKLPKTGFPPEENNIMLITAGILGVLSLLYVARKKQII
jgi:type VI secretion system secreted protein VgrG